MQFNTPRTARAPASAANPPLLPLAEATDPARCGGKAARLGAMLRAGLPVPDGWCVPTEGFAALMATVPEGGALLEALATADPAAAPAIAGRLRAAIQAAPAPAGLAEALAAVLPPDAAYAVRSSATAEDLAEASFAGQQDTFLDVRGADAVRAAVQACQASLFSDRAVAYRARQGLDPRRVRMAVVIQRMVPAEVAGVAFTVDPVTGDPERMVVEAVRGLGEALVSGQAVPDRAVLGRDLAVREPAGEGILEEGLARRVGDLALRCEALFGGPQDVEWAFAEGTLWLLQSRPVTTAATGVVPPPPAVEGPDDAVWSNVNVGELLPGVATPMTWSFVDRLIRLLFGTFARWLDVDFDREPFIGRVGGRVYANVGTFARMLRSLPSPGELDLSRTFGGAMDGPEVAEALRRQLAQDGGRRRSLLRLLGRVPAMAMLFLRNLGPGRGERALRAVAARNSQLMARDLAAMDDAALLHVLGPGLAEGLDVPDAVAQAAVGMGCTDLVFRWTREHLGDAAGGLANRLLAGTGQGMASAEAARGLRELAVLAAATPEVARVVADAGDFAEARARLETIAGGGGFLAAWAAWMDLHGHHAPAEIDVARARWAEQPDRVLAWVRDALTHLDARDPAAEDREREARRREALALARTRLGFLRGRLMPVVLERGRRGLVIRENFKSEAVRVLFLARRVLRELGRRLADRGVLSTPDDVFMLYAEELGPALGGTFPGSVPATVAARRREFLRWEALPPPPPVVVGRYTPERSAAAEVPVGEGSFELRGLSVSPGRATGPARVLLVADGAEQVQPGEILVAPFTDPGWTPCFLPAAGLVVDMGGLLSHGSIVAREYGLPAVVNVGPATRRIRTGQQVTVDGDRGVVIVHAAAEAAGAEG